jgi:hypothetical protein
MKILSLSILIICFIIISCSKEEQLVNHSKERNKQLILTNTNPMDSVGIWHNLVLEKMMQYSHTDYGTDLSGLNLEIHPLGSQYINNLLVDYFIEANDDLGYPNSMSEQQLINSLIASNYETVSDPEAFFSAFKLKLSTYSEKDSIYMFQAFYYIMLAMDSVWVNELDSNYDYQNIYDILINNLDNLVGTMLADTTYPHNSIGYKSIAVLQHSLDFWKDYYAPFLTKNIKIGSSIQGMTKRGKDVSNLLWAGTTDFYTTPVWPVTSTATWWALDKYGSGFWDAVSDGLWYLIHGCGL